MSWEFNLSLEHRAVVNLAIMMWNYNDTLNKIAEFPCKSKFVEKCDFWFILEDVIIRNTSKLLLPNALLTKAVSLVKPIGIEIFKWKESQMKISMDKKFLKLSLTNICWTAQGTVNDKKTAALLIKDDSLDISIRYKLACTYCLESDISVLWNKMSRNKKFNFRYPVDRLKPDFVTIWTFHVDNQEARLLKTVAKFNFTCVLHYAFYIALRDGNKAAVQFYWKKLTVETRKSCLSQAIHLVASSFWEFNDKCDYGIFFPTGFFPEILLFLFSQTEKETLKELEGQNWAYRVLRSFLDWPIQAFFTDTTKAIQTLIGNDEVDSIIYAIMRKMRWEFKDYNYALLLREFWRECPELERRFVQSKPYYILQFFLEIHDKEGVLLLLRKATPEMRERLLFQHGGRKICVFLAERKNWDSLTLFVNECLPRGNIEKFRAIFKKRITRSSTNESMKKNIYFTIYTFLDHLIQRRGKKRIMEDDSGTHSKRLCDI